MNKEELNNAILNNKQINSNEVVVASTRMNKSIGYLKSKLDNLNYATNYRLNRYSLKKNSNHPRVSFYCFNQYAINNVHSHIYVSVPPCYDYDHVLSVMSNEWAKLNPKFDLFREQVRDVNAYAKYSAREFNNSNTDTFEVI